MKLLTRKTCKECGGEIVRKGVDCGYSSAKSLGRPAGAKGRDEFAILEICQDCGGGKYEILPVPCHICGGTGTEYVDIAGRSNDITGIFDYVPGLPSSVNLCGKPDCGQNLNAEIDRLVTEAFDAGGYE